MERCVTTVILGSERCDITVCAEPYAHSGIVHIRILIPIHIHSSNVHIRIFNCCIPRGIPGVDLWGSPACSLPGGQLRFGSGFGGFLLLVRLFGSAVKTLDALAAVHFPLASVRLHVVRAETHWVLRFDSTSVLATTAGGCF